MNLKKLPLRKLLQLFWLIRGALWTVKRPTGTYISVNMPLNEVREVLGRNHFTNNWEFSYKYKGEQLNMRRPEYVDDEYEWYQLHARGWWNIRAKESELYPHLELEPSEYPKEHISNTNLDEAEGAILLMDILDEEGIDYRTVNLTSDGKRESI